MVTFKIGDLVIVDPKDTLDEHRETNGCRFAIGMREFIGRTFEIREIVPNPRHGWVYYLKNGNDWCFLEQWLHPVSWKDVIER